MSLLKPGYDPTTPEQLRFLQTEDRALLIAVRMITGCAGRRYDLPSDSNEYWGVELCFGERKPIVPCIALSPNKYYSIASANFYYKIMLQPATYGGSGFEGRQLNVHLPIEAGPEAMAKALVESIKRLDFTQMIAVGTIEHFMSEPEKFPGFWTNLNRALCAIYLGDYDQARTLLEDAKHFVTVDKRPWSDEASAIAQSYLTKLDADPDALRQELTERMNYNWSHFKVVDRLSAN